ncbi:MAG TPA: NAD(P)H-hydrate dehydratase [Verrucomicrobiaceae bacterium]
MVVTCGQMRDAEEAAFARGICAADLMEAAGQGMARAVSQFFPRAGHLVLYLGKGNNAGDALVAARHLADRGWRLWARPVFDVREFKELPARHWKSLGEKVRVVESADAIAQLEGEVVLLDGLLGIGATGPLRGKLADAVREMNQLRRSRHAVIIALDLPSGLEAGGGREEQNCIAADFTFTVGLAKDILLRDEATDVVGRLVVIPLRELDGATGDASRRVLTPPVLLPMLPRRNFDFHKGDAGRVGVVAGSRGFLGAAILCATGALRVGAGLVSLFVKENEYEMIASLSPPEIMVHAVKDYREVLQAKLDALALGPGLGAAHDDELLELVKAAEIPTVVDADALNALARRGLDELKHSSAPRLLTPHPGEMARLAQHEKAWRDKGRAELAAAFAAKFPGTVLLLKGARTVIASAAQPLSFNTTGHPGMATGGVGDVLCGLCAALAGQGVSLADAACLGSWLSGRAAEIALRDGWRSPESLSAGDVAQHLGAALVSLRAMAF